MPVPPEGQDPHEMLQELLRRLLNDHPGMDGAQLGSLIGDGVSSPELRMFFDHLGRAMTRPTKGLDWDSARNQALLRARAEETNTDDADRALYEPAFRLGQLWLDGATHFTATKPLAELLTRSAWVTDTMPTWAQVAEPVADSITNALLGAIDAHPHRSLERRRARPDPSRHQRRALCNATR